MTSQTRTEPPSPPKRNKPRSEWTIADVAAFQRTGREPETDEFLDYVRKVHEDAGLELPAVTQRASSPIDGLSVANHLQRLSPEQVPSLLSYSDVAAILNVSTRTVARYATHGRLKAHRIGNRTVRFDPRDVVAFMQTQAYGGVDPKVDSAQ